MGVGIDVGILKYAHDSDGTAVEGPHLFKERERLEREQRDLSRKSHGSTNDGVQVRMHRSVLRRCRSTGTTEEYAEYGVSTDKPRWVREHSCPSGGFEANRDLNAAYNILSRGLTKVGVVHPDSTSPEPDGSGWRTRALLSSLPAETALPTGIDSLPAKRAHQISEESDWLSDSLSLPMS